MLKPMEIIGSIAASATRRIAGNIQLVRCRTLSITVRLTCGASLDANPNVNLYYSPDGKNVDTLTYATFAMTYTAGSAIQKTGIIDPPEHGYIYVDVQNASSADTLTNVQVWYSIQAWSPDDSVEAGDIRKR